MNIEEARKGGADIADWLWMVASRKVSGLDSDLYGTIYWEDCLTLGIFLYRIGFRKTEEPSMSAMLAIAEGYFIK